MSKSFLKNSKISSLKLGLKNFLLLKMCYFAGKSRILSNSIKLNEFFANKSQKNINIKFPEQFIESSKVLST